MIRIKCVLSRFSLALCSTRFNGARVASQPASKLVVVRAAAQGVECSSHGGIHVCKKRETLPC